MQQPDALHVEVSYRFGEYLRIVDDHLRDTQGPREGWNQRFFHAWVLPVVLLPVFLRKQRQVGRCRFSIDGSGITRSAREVFAGRSCRRRYARAVPIPTRSLP